jgi:hypothetical protein
MDHGGKSQAAARQLAPAHGPRRLYFTPHVWTLALATFLDHGVGRGALHPLASDLAGCSSASPPLSLRSVLFSVAGDSMRNQGEPRPSHLPARHRRPPSRDVVHLRATTVLDSGAERGDGFARCGLVRLGRARATGARRPLRRRQSVGFGRALRHLTEF